MAVADSPDPGQDPADTAPRARLGVPWVDPTHVEEFLRQTLQDSTITIRYTEPSGWAVEGGRRSGDLSRSVWGTAEVCAEEIAHMLLNPPVSSVWSREGILQKAEQLNQHFDAWIWKSPELAESARRRYNELFSAEVHTYPDVKLPFPGPRNEFRAPRDRTVTDRALDTLLDADATDPPILLYEVGPGKDPRRIPGLSALRAARAAAPGFPTGVAARIQEAMQEFTTPPSAEAASSNDQSTER